MFGDLFLRRFTLFAIGGFALLALLCPFAPNLESLLVLRTLQGLMAGCLPPMLMTVALRFLPPGIKLYGLGAYALTATFGPNLGLPLAAFWFEYVGWQWVFWQVIPLCLVAMAAVSHGIPRTRCARNASASSTASACSPASRRSAPW